jgi:hypothetical protein
MQTNAFFQYKKYIALGIIFGLGLTFYIAHAETGDIPEPLPVVTEPVPEETVTPVLPPETTTESTAVSEEATTTDSVVSEEATTTEPTVTPEELAAPEPGITPEISEPVAVPEITEPTPVALTETEPTVTTPDTLTEAAYEESYSTEPSECFQGEWGMRFKNPGECLRILRR